MAQITQSELEQIYQEELGRSYDPSGAQTYLDPAKGYSAEDVRGFVQGSFEKQYLYEPRKRYQQWLDEGNTLDNEFASSSAGQLIWAPLNQKMGWEYQVAIEDPDQMKAFAKQLGLGEDMVLYQDVGAGEGGKGILGAVDSALGTNFQEDIGRLLPNEIKAYYAAQTANLGMRLVGGEQWQREASGVFEENLGLQQGEWDQYADLAAKTAAVVVGTAAGGWGLAMIPAFTAAQGTAKNIGGSKYERQSWGDIAEQTAWDAAAAAAGAGGAIPTGIVQAAQTKARGGTWTEAAIAGGVSAATAGLSKFVGADSTEGVRTLAAAGQVALPAAQEYYLTGDAKAAAYTAAASAAGTYAGAKYGSGTGSLVGAAANIAASELTRDSATERLVSQYMEQGASRTQAEQLADQQFTSNMYAGVARSVALGALSGNKTKGLTFGVPTRQDIGLLTRGMTSPEALVSPRIYNRNVYNPATNTRTSRWFSGVPEFEVVYDKSRGFAPVMTESGEFQVNVPSGQRVSGLLETAHNVPEGFKI